MPPKLSDHERLVRDVNLLGLPAASDGIQDKSASKLTVDDMATLGWRICTQPVTALWNEDPPEARKILAQHAKAPLDIVNQIAANRKAFMFQGDIRIPTQVSTHYKLPNGSLDLANEVDEERSDTQLLKVCLHYVSAAADEAAAINESGANQDLMWVKTRVQPTTRRDLVRLVAVAPDLVFAEQGLTTQEAEMKQLKEASVISLLRLTGVKSTESSNISELAVERVVGSALSGIFYNAKKVHAMSGQKVIAPLIICPRKPFAYSDIAAVREAREEGYIEPVVIIGEGKFSRQGLNDDTESQAEGTRTEHVTPTAVAQMAAAVHPTLILLVLAHYLRTPLALEDIANGTKLPTFDDKSMVYGIYYDEQKVLIYAHFPQVKKVEDDKFAIRFFQVEVASFPLLGTSFLHRWRMVTALFHVQKHADMISEVLRPVITSYSI